MIYSLPLQYYSEFNYIFAFTREFYKHILLGGSSGDGLNSLSWNVFFSQFPEVIFAGYSTSN